MRLPKDTLTALLDKISVFGCEKTSEGSVDYIICPKNNLPNISIEVGDHYLILPGKDVFDPMTNSDFKKLRIQFMEVQISLIGQPFFRYFHTKFDHENKILKFYTENKESMIYSYAKPNDDKAKHFDPDNIVNSWLNENTIKIIAIVSVCVGAILIIVIIIKCGKKSCCKKNKN